MGIKMRMIGYVFFLFSFFLICQEKAVVYDDFVRFTNQKVVELGTMSDGIHKWIKRVPEGYDDLIFGSMGRLYIGYKSGLPICDTGVAVENFTTRDGVIEIEIGPSVMKGRTNGAYINYRAKDIQSAAGAKTQDAYHVGLELEEEKWEKDKDIVLYYGTTLLAYGDFSDKIDTQANHTLKVLFEGNHHTVWFDGKKVIDYTDNDASRVRPGYVGFGGFYSCGYFHKFSLYTLGEEKGIAKEEQKTEVKGIFKKEREIEPVKFQGKPIFIISTYSTPEIGGTEEEWAEWVSAGANVAQLAVNIQKIDEEIEKIKKHLERCEKYKVPALFYVHNIGSQESEGNPIYPPPLPTTQEDIPKRIENFKKLFEITKNNPWVLGYYFFDEPENQFYQQYAKIKGIKKWEQKYDSGLAAWIADSFKWLYDLVKKEHPNAYVFVLCGWETCYKDMAPIYDVLQANSYPNLSIGEPRELYVVIHDARMAADACKATGKTFIYMPGMVDIVWPNAKPGSYKETRYCFFAPITQGAMGLNPFCLYRCSQNYRQAVVYPILREVKRFIPWFLGEWHDEKVKSDHDTATKDYLLKYPPRMKELMSDKGVQTIKMAGVPDCSYILRKNPKDGSYLLLAVNNCREPIDVTFSFKDINLPDKALEMLEYYYVPITNNELKDHFGPFDVRAYIFKPK